MPIPTREAIKAYFETGDVPTEAQFAEFIDAVYDLAQESQDTATDAVNIATAAAARTPVAMGLVKIASGANAAPVAPVAHREVACTIGVVQNTPGGLYPRAVTATVTVTLDDANADARYPLDLQVAASELGAPASHALSAKAAGSFEFVLTWNVANSGELVERWVTFVVYA
jgi:hypothetical protein